MRKTSLTLLSFLLLLAQITAFAQHTVSGFVYDSQSGEALINTHVYNETEKMGTLTNPYGFFSFTTMETNRLRVSFSYVGYAKQTKMISVNSDTAIIVMLAPGQKLDDIVVKASKQNNESFTPSGKLSFTGKQLEMLPGLLGEKDVIKSLQLMPGIQMGKEGSAGIFVRGGDRGQNLILLDGMPVYNINHLFGFFSVFTPEIIKSVDVYKGGFPARYSGRLSSVIDVRAREGNLYKKKLDFTVGTISSKIIYESPIKKGRSSFIVAARRTYADLLYTPLSAIKYEGIYKTTNTWSGYNFFDINVKSNFKISEKDRLYFSIYTGKDKLFLSEKESYNQRGLSHQSTNYDKLENRSKFNNQWGNLTLSSRWNHIYMKKHFSNTTISYSTYNYNTLFGNDYLQVSIRDTLDESISYKNHSHVKDLSLTTDFDISILPELKILAGLSGSWRSFTPGRLDLNYELNNNPKENFLRNVHSSSEFFFEYSAYLENHLSLFNNLFINAGGAFVFVDEQGSSFFSFQPRFMAKYNIKQNVSAFGSYTKMCQPVHLLVDNGSTFPVDMWVPAVKNLEPESSNQVDFGIEYKLNNSYEIKTEIYYKKMENVINYKNGESFFSLNENWYNKIIQSKGTSKGIEVLLKKKSGKLNGWIGYSLSESERQFEDLNRGKPFHFKYDNTHQLKLVGMYAFSKKIDLFGSWVYSTGMPVTLSLTGYSGDPGFSRAPLYGMLNDLGFFDQKIYSPQNVTYYDGINNNRLPDYHRLDFGITFKKQKQRGERTWSFSLYNVYARNNPMMIFAKTNENGNVVYNNFTVFSFVPSVSYRFNFNAFE